MLQRVIDKFINLSPVHPIIGNTKVELLNFRERTKKRLSEAVSYGSLPVVRIVTGGGLTALCVCVRLPRLAAGGVPCI